MSKWHSEQPQEPIDTRSMAGRVRRNVAQFTEKLPSPVLGTETDGVKLALAELYEDSRKFPNARVVNSIHDEILIECPEGEAEAVVAWAAQHMHRAMSRILQGVPIVVDHKIGKTWG